MERVARMQVVFHDTFWSKWRDVARKESIPYQWKALNDELPAANSSHCLKNFHIVSGKAKGEFYGCVFQDSDIAKWLESVAYALAWQKDEELEKLADQAIDDVVAAQQEDGYLNTYYTLTGIEKRFTNLMDNHELYCVGHMLEAAVAYYQTTGKRKLLDAMIRCVDCIDCAIGPEENKIHGYPGHPEIELALMRLYEITQDEKHLKLAKYFVDERGKSPLFFEEESRRMNRRSSWLNGPMGYQYYQAGKPIREQTEAEGHSVRALYLYAGAADVARETNDQTLKETCQTLWDNVVNRRMYITGGVGSSAYGESFTFDYDLPNDTCYTETCASIALIFFAKRMLSLKKDGAYADVMERALYNGVISGMQLDGKRFFYTNPLEVLPEACKKDAGKAHIKAVRQAWFDCACCPPNLIRLLMSLQNYLISVEGDTLYAHLYASSEWHARMGDGQICFDCETNYPWDGKIRLTCKEAGPTAIGVALRIPAWCRQYALTVNGKPEAFSMQSGYAHIRRVWQPGEQLILNLEMPVELVRAHPLIREDAGKLAVTRGPIVYALEEKDNGADLHLIRLQDVCGDAFKVANADGLEDMVALCSPGYRESWEEWPPETLYASDAEVKLQPVSLTWIPYFAWGNRGTGEMQVWTRI